MSDNKLNSLFENLRDNVFVNQEALHKLEAQVKAGKITDSEAYRRLRQLDPEHAKGPFFLSSKRLEDEWDTLAKAIDDAESRTKKLASSQFLLGLMALPIFVALVLVSLLFGWHQGQASGVIVAILAGCLTTVAAHSFFVLRIHQQASLAAERLSEKRVGMLFLRIALSRESSKDSARLIEAGTTMFLGHHVATTIPLQAEDYSTTKKQKEQSIQGKK